MSRNAPRTKDMNRVEEGDPLVVRTNQEDEEYIPAWYEVLYYFCLDHPRYRLECERTDLIYAKRDLNTQYKEQRKHVKESELRVQEETNKLTGKLEDLDQQVGKKLNRPFTPAEVQQLIQEEPKYNRLYLKCLEQEKVLLHAKMNLQVLSAGLHGIDKCRTDVKKALMDTRLVEQMDENQRKSHHSRALDMREYSRQMIKQLQNVNKDAEGTMLTYQIGDMNDEKKQTVKDLGKEEKSIVDAFLQRACVRIGTKTKLTTPTTTTTTAVVTAKKEKKVAIMV